tara:strand:- start:22003 stop:22368 length:366 start_codon:yes stop_codon:yes gene_type:complete
MQVATADVRFSASHFAEKVYSRVESLITVSDLDGSIQSRQVVSRNQEQADPFREGTDLLDLYQAGRDVSKRTDVAVENFEASESAAKARPSLLETFAARLEEASALIEPDPLEALRMTPQD